LKHKGSSIVRIRTRQLSVSMPSKDANSNRQAAGPFSSIPREKPTFGEEEEILGGGVAGTVAKAYVVSPGDYPRMKAGQYIALKRIHYSTQSGMDPAKEAQEIHLLKAFRHPNIVEYYGSFLDQDRKCVCIMMEYCEGNSLRHVYSKHGALSLPVVKTYTAQMLQGLRYLHSNGVIHRDIKSLNVVLSGSGICKLSDFGCATGHKQFYSMQGTLRWMAPEVFQITSDQGAGFAADVWSVGCTVWEMLTAKMPFPLCDNEYALMKFIIEARNDDELLPQDLPAEARSFLQRCLRRDPKQRSTVDELLSDPFVAAQTESEQLRAPSSPASPSGRGGDRAGDTTPQGERGHSRGDESKLADALEWWQSVVGEAQEMPADTFFEALRCPNLQARLLPVVLNSSQSGSDTITLSAFKYFVYWFGPWRAIVRDLEDGGGTNIPDAHHHNEGDGYDYYYGGGEAHVVHTLLQRNWFRPIMTQAEVEGALSKCKAGSYCIRYSSSYSRNPGCYTLSLKGEGANHFFHYRIHRPSGSWEYVFKERGSDELFFDSLEHFVGYFEMHDLRGLKGGVFRLQNPIP
jgi:serine/threonine protein kinase